MRSKPARQGTGAPSVACTISQPGMATTPEENAATPGRKR